MTTGIHWSRRRTTAPDNLEEDELSNLETFVDETHLDLVIRLMHFYDITVAEKLKAGKKRLFIPEDILFVLKFVGWHKLRLNDVKQFLGSLSLAYNSKHHLSRDETRVIFKAWIEKVTSEKALLKECFEFFDIDKDRYFSRDEIIKLLYRTTEEERTKLCDDIISKLTEGVYYMDDLYPPKNKVRKRNPGQATKLTQNLAKEQEAPSTLKKKIFDYIYTEFNEIAYNIGLAFLFFWTIFLLIVVPLMKEKV